MNDCNEVKAKLAVFIISAASNRVSQDDNDKFLRIQLYVDIGLNLS